MKYDFWKRDMNEPEKAAIVATYDAEMDKWSGDNVDLAKRMVENYVLDLPKDAKELPFSIDGSIIWVAERRQELR